MANKLKLGVLISGRGTNLQAIIDACKDKDFPAEINVVISNKSDAYGLVRAEKAGIKNFFIDHKSFDSREKFDNQVTKILKDNNVDLVCLAGFMRLLSQKFVNDWQNKAINIHPSLLPAFKGASAQQDALDAGSKVTGVTTHFVTFETDAGPIILQEAININPDDNFDSLRERMLILEHKLYVETIRILAQKNNITA